MTHLSHSAGTQPAIILSKQRKFSDEVFGYYLQNRPLFLSLIRTKEIELLEKYARLDGKVLDFGCGDGFFMNVLRKFAPDIFKSVEITGVDVNEKVLNEAKSIKSKNKISIVKSNPKSQITNGKIYGDVFKYDGINLPFKNNSFDTVFSNCVFEHLPYLEQNLKEMYRVLKPKGKLIATVMAEPWNRYNMLPSTFWRKAQIHLNLLTYSQWIKLFQKTGFKVVNKVGYLDKTQSRVIELCHFLSVPYLVSYKLFRKWDAFGWLYNTLIPIRLVARILSDQPKLADSAAIFFELVKN